MLISELNNTTILEEESVSCLEEEAGTQGFATEQQIRDCFAPIYNGSNNDDDDNNNNDDDDNNN